MQPLDGICVVSIAYNMPGPVAVGQLQALGARVLKVDPPAGDPLERGYPELYALLTAGQEIVALDLKQPHERERLDAHLAEADLLVTSQATASLARLALDWPALHARFPRLCQVAIVGRDPPDDDEPGHDLTYLAAAGLVAPPALPPTLWADMAGAQAAVTEALALLHLRHRTGEGAIGYVSIARVLETIALPLVHGITALGGRLGGALPNYNLYRATTGWVALAALEPQFWTKLQDLLGLSQPSYDDLARVFSTRTAQEWETWAREHRLPIRAVSQ